MWSAASESESHLQGSKRRRQDHTLTPWQIPAERSYERKQEKAEGGGGAHNMDGEIKEERTKRSKL
jgi:hypothetical protein